MIDLAEWEKWAERPSTVQRNDFMAKQLWRDGKTDFLAIPRGKNVEYLMPTRQKHKYYSRLANELHTIDLKKHLDNYQRAASKLIEKSRINLNQNNKQLALAYKKFWEANDELALFYQTPWVVETYLDPILKQRLAMEFSDEKAQEIYEKVTAPTELIAFQKMQIEIQKLASKSHSQTDAGKLVQKFSWIAEYSLQEELYDANYFEKQLELAKHSRQDIEQTIHQNQQKFQEVITLLDKETAKLARLINKYVTLRTHRVDALKKALFNMRPFYKHIAKQLQAIGTTYRNVINLTQEEILAFLKSGKEPELVEVRKRTTTLAYLCRKGCVSFIPVTKIKEEKIAAEAREASGLTANRGIASGPAVIVVTKSDLLKVRTGCIMVARTTFPEYTPFMKKAVAIVTDEGGITSHAAIVSRELGVPCVVGTKNSTKIFTDNELITVDGQKGTVEKIQ